MNGVHLSASPEETRRLGATLAANLQPGAVVLLRGDLGAGKTCFVQGLAEGLGGHDVVTSPTYALVQEYDTTPPLAHADLYRLESTAAVLALGLEEWIEAGHILAVEWGERAPGLWPPDAWQVHLLPGDDGENSRKLLFSREDPT